MTRSQPPDDWKQQLTAAAEDFDVKHQVLQKIKERQKEQEGYSVKKRIGLIAAAILVFGGTSAYAAVKVFELKNEQGDVVVKVEQQQNVEAPSSESVFETAQQKARESLKPGETAAIYIPGAEGPGNQMSFASKPLNHENNLASLQEEVGDFYSIPSELVGGYTYVNGIVAYRYNYNQPELFEEMRQEAEKDNKDFVTRKVSTQPIARLLVEYTSSKGMVGLGVTNFGIMKSIMEVVEPDEIVEKVKVKNHEALYIVRKEPNGTEERFVKFYRDDQKKLFEVIGDQNFAKEELLKIAEGIK
jgi:hypothetical protein